MLYRYHRTVNIACTTIISLVRQCNEMLMRWSGAQLLRLSYILWILSIVTYLVFWQLQTTQDYSNKWCLGFKITNLILLLYIYTSYMYIIKYKAIYFDSIGYFMKVTSFRIRLKWRLKLLMMLKCAQ